MRGCRVDARAHHQRRRIVASSTVARHGQKLSCARDGGAFQVECEYHTVLVTNRKKGLVMRRVFLHAKLQKPA